MLFREEKLSGGGAPAAAKESKVLTHGLPGLPGLRLMMVPVYRKYLSSCVTPQRQKSLE